MQDKSQITHQEPAASLQQLITDLYYHLRAEWDARRLPADCWPAHLAKRLDAAVAAGGVAVAPVIGHADAVAVDKLSVAMNAKLALQRSKGFGGWYTAECTQQRLSDMLRSHVDKGDPVDVANFCAFLLARGETIAPQAANTSAVAAPDAVTDEMVHAALRVQHPNMYRVHLRHPENGPASEARTEKEIDTARKMIAAALAATRAATESREELAHRLIGEVKTADAIATAICQRVAELGDRSSPEDWPEAMLVTGNELHLVAREAVMEAQERQAAAMPVHLPVAWASENGMHWLNSAERSSGAFLNANLHKSKCAAATEPLYTGQQMQSLIAAIHGLPSLAVDPSDAQLIALNAGERFFSESPSKYPEAGHSTQYHAGEPGVIAFARAALALRADPAAHEQTFQNRVQPWMMACFGPEISADRMERNHRFLEEALELVQCLGCTASEAHQLVDYVYGRPWGEPAQEAGGVMVTLAALCQASSLDMHTAGDVELARIWTKVEAIRAKQAAKPKHSPLPISAPHLPSVQESVEKLPRYTYGYKGDDWGMNQSLRSYEAPDGSFLRRDEVLNAIAAITAKGNEA